MARADNLTVRQLARRLGGFSGLAMVGTPATIADQMEEWLLADGCDGFNVMFPYVPGGLDDFVDTSFRSCSGEACSGANMRARHCEKILVCRGRRTGSSAERDQRLRLRPQSVFGRPDGRTDQVTEIERYQ
jgi:hypothetical protein